MSVLLQDHALGCDQTIIDDKLGGDYKALTDGLRRNVFIADPRNKSTPLIGEVRSSRSPLFSVNHSHSVS